MDVGNTAYNVIPGAATAKFNVRYNDLYSLESLKAEIAGGSTRRASLCPDLPRRGERELSHRAGPVRGDGAGRGGGRDGQRPQMSTTGGTSDARFIKSLCPVVEFGLVGQTMHMVNEATPVADLTALTAIYERLIARYFATFAA